MHHQVFVAQFLVGDARKTNFKYAISKRKYMNYNQDMTFETERRWLWAFLKWLFTLGVQKEMQPMGIARLLVTYKNCWICQPFCCAQKYIQWILLSKHFSMFHFIFYNNNNYNFNMCINYMGCIYFWILSIILTKENGKRFLAN